jgi:hypothetical protein
MQDTFNGVALASGPIRHKRSQDVGSEDVDATAAERDRACRLGHLKRSVDGGPGRTGHSSQVRLGHGDRRPYRRASEDTEEIGEAKKNSNLGGYEQGFGEPIGQSADVGGEDRHEHVLDDRVVDT